MILRGTAGTCLSKTPLKVFGGGENLVVSVFCYTFAPDFENRQPKNHADSEGARKLLLKKRGAPRSCFCVPNPQKNVSTGQMLYRSQSGLFERK